MAAWKQVPSDYRNAGNLITEKEIRLAEKVAWRVGSKWSEVEIDDLQSHLYLFMAENVGHLERWRREPGDNGKLYVALRREAAKYCAKEQAARVGRPSLTDDFYTADLLRRALPYVFEEVPQTTVAENPVTGRPETIPSESNLALTIITDIRGAFFGLNPEVRQVLAWRFRDGLTFEEIGELKGISKDGAKKSVDRAVQRLADSLAGYRL